MEPRLSLITLGVADVARARRFYEALGFKAGSGLAGERRPSSPLAASCWPCSARPGGRR